LICDGFFMDSITAPGKKIIYVYRSSAPRIVLYGDPIACKRNLFVTSPDGQVTINSQTDQLGISLMRQHPKSPKLIGPIKSSHRVKDLIGALGNSPTFKKGQRMSPGLEVAYSEVIAILKNMCDSNIIEAQFIAEPMPQILPVTKTAEVPETK
ncbi:MAG: hypothetical protein KAS23_01380, partial [Anaerohalosphaera sp.]|nr:hypothetical protein [Anaerohalosphaera sp.]